ncbi:MAG: hypothetical protein OXQ29_22910 [Rhodospirillaceae bacterium]|nr:hypothetical protein [Rhodospirillaceae bacterium]
MANSNRLDRPLTGRSFRRLLLFSFVTMLPVLGVYVLLGGTEHYSWLWMLSMSYGFGFGITTAVYRTTGRPRFLN